MVQTPSAIDTDHSMMPAGDPDSGDVMDSSPILDALDVVARLRNVDDATWQRAQALRDLLVPHAHTLQGLRGETAKKALREIGRFGEEAITLLTQQKFLQ